MTCSQGWKTVVFAQASASSPPTFTAASDIQDVVSENMQIVDSLQGNEQVIRGRRDRIVQTVALGGITVGGTLSMLLNYKRLGFWLKAATGTATSPYIQTEALLPHGIGVKRATSSYLRSYSGCLVDTLTIAGSEGGPITADVSLIGKTYTDTASSTTVPTYTAVDYSSGGWAPFMFSAATLTVNGGAIGIQGFSLEINNHLSPSALNNVFVTDICSEDFSVMLSVTSKAGDLYNALYDNTSGGTGKGKPGSEPAMVLTLTHASGTMVATMPKWSFPRAEGGTNGRGTIQTTFSGECLADAGLSPAQAISIAVT